MRTRTPSEWSNYFTSLVIAVISAYFFEHGDIQKATYIVLVAIWGVLWGPL